MSFSDVDPTKHPVEDIEWLASTGITTGIGDNKFGPDQPVTRAQMASFLHRNANYFGLVPKAPAPPSLGQILDTYLNQLGGFQHQYDPVIQRAAKRRAVICAQNKLLSHADDLILMNPCAEVLAWNPDKDDDSETLWEIAYQWRRSTGHWNIITNPDYKFGALGLASGWTQEGRPAWYACGLYTWNAGTET